MITEESSLFLFGMPPKTSTVPDVVSDGGSRREDSEHRSFPSAVLGGGLAAIMEQWLRLTDTKQFQRSRRVRL